MKFLNWAISLPGRDQHAHGWLVVQSRIFRFHYLMEIKYNNAHASKRHRWGSAAIFGGEQEKHEILLRGTYL